MPLSPDTPFTRPGQWWRREPSGRILCELCPRACSLADGDRGFCFVRQNIDGEMALTTYGLSTGFCIDPIEKKPLNHFLPGTSVLSFGTAGCNLGCKFCQNWDISKSREVEKLSARAMPDEIAAAAVGTDCRSVAFTYNDPVIWAEYAIDTAHACRDRGIKSVAVTAGYIEPKARDPFFSAMDAANVDLKAFTEEFYHKITLSHLQPVLDTICWLKHESNVWFELTNLIIPDANDSPDEIRKMCDWVLDAVGDEVPVHFSAFHPDFRMLDRPHTPPETLAKAHELAQQAGIRYAYVGNVDDLRRQSTWCPSCGEMVIERNRYRLGKWNLADSACAHCSHPIAGWFESKPGTWGPRRQVVDMRVFHKEDSQKEAGDSSYVPVSLKTSAQLPSAEETGRESTGPKSFQSATELFGLTSEVVSSVPFVLRSRDSVSVASPTPSTKILSPQEISGVDGRALLRTAAEIVWASVTGRAADPNRAVLESVVAERPVSGTFVSLKRGRTLRSCCGTIRDVLPLMESLRCSAERAATDDPRFPRVSIRELPWLTLEVWILGAPQTMQEQGLERAKEIEVGRHGLIVSGRGQTGLLLPEVPVEQGWNRREFLEQTCVKAGLPTDAWLAADVRVAKFEGLVWKDEIADLLDELPLDEAPPEPDEPSGGLRIVRPDGDDISITIPFPEKTEGSICRIAVSRFDKPPITLPAFVRYVDVARETVSAMLSGGVTSYFRPELPDAEVHGLVLTLPMGSALETPQSVFRFSWKQPMPLQATLHELCQALTESVRGRVAESDLQNLHLLVGAQPAVHGIVRTFTDEGLHPARHAVAVFADKRIGFAFDRQSDSFGELLRRASNATGSISPASGRVLSLRTLSSIDSVVCGSRRIAVNSREVRTATVCGRFYPRAADDCRRMMDVFTAHHAGIERRSVRAAMVPHAGWRFSGQLAADVMAQIKWPSSVLIIGPKHTPHGIDFAVAPHDKWQFPGGSLLSDRPLIESLLDHVPGLEADAVAHRQEHAIEVELPMIHRMAPETRIAAIAMSSTSLPHCVQIASGLAEVIRSQPSPPLLLISSDMNHFEDDATTRKKDAMALKQITEMDANNLLNVCRKHNISMCGVVPAALVMMTLKMIGQSATPRLIGYRTSADETGDKSRVVGYAGVVFE